SPRPRRKRKAPSGSKRSIRFVRVGGNLQSHGEVDLVARVEGYLESIQFEEGAIVKKGQLLFVIEREPYEATLQQEEANAAQQKATLTRAKEEYERQLRLIKRKATSESTLEQWRAAYESAQAALKAARAKADLARINLGYTKISAPFDGRMERHLVDPGNLVGSGGATKLATIHRLNPIYAYFNLNEQDVTRLIKLLRKKKGGLAYENEKIPVFLGVRGEEGYPHQGELDYASTILSQTTGTLQLRGLFPNPMENEVPELLPGMYARVRIPVEEQHHALLVPDSALQITQGQHYLLLVNQHDVVEQRFVTIGRKVDKLRVIPKGLQSTDRVVVSGIQYAHPGSKVSPEEEQKKAAVGELLPELVPAHTVRRQL
ncbi:MAG: efflux RND transporter periplasmic adaptor subunit, partial [Desulfobacterales bacterium]